MKGLESDEVEFLDFCSQKQQEIDKQREMEEAHVLQQYRVSLLTPIAIIMIMCLDRHACSFGTVQLVF